MGSKNPGPAGMRPRGGGGGGGVMVGVGFMATQKGLPQRGAPWCHQAAPGACGRAGTAEGAGGAVSALPVHALLKSTSSWAFNPRSNERWEEQQPTKGPSSLGARACGSDCIDGGCNEVPMIDGRLSEGPMIDLSPEPGFEPECQQELEPLEAKLRLISVQRRLAAIKCDAFLHDLEQHNSLSKESMGSREHHNSLAKEVGSREVARSLTASPHASKSTRPNARAQRLSSSSFSRTESQVDLRASSIREADDGGLLLTMSSSLPSVSYLQNISSKGACLPPLAACPDNHPRMPVALPTTHAQGGYRAGGTPPAASWHRGTKPDFQMTSSASVYPSPAYDGLPCGCCSESEPCQQTARVLAFGQSGDMMLPSRRLSDSHEGHGRVDGRGMPSPKVRGMPKSHSTNETGASQSHHGGYNILSFGRANRGETRRKSRRKLSLEIHHSSREDFELEMPALDVPTRIPSCPNLW